MSVRTIGLAHSATSVSRPMRVRPVIGVRTLVKLARPVASAPLNSMGRSAVNARTFGRGMIAINVVTASTVTCVIAVQITGRVTRVKSAPLSLPVRTAIAVATASRANGVTGVQIIGRARRARSASLSSPVTIVTDARRGLIGVQITGPSSQFAGESDCANFWRGAQCDECEPQFAGADCDRCQGRYVGENCDVCPPQFTGAQCNQCSGFWTGPNCDVCEPRFGGAQCDRCADERFRPGACRTSNPDDPDRCADACVELLGGPAPATPTAMH